MLQSSEKAIRELYEVTSSPLPGFEHRIRALLDFGCRRFRSFSRNPHPTTGGDDLLVQYANPNQEPYSRRRH